jgi:hypothetical protein
MSVQNELLGDMPESFFNRLNLDSCAEAVLTFPHSNRMSDAICSPLDER